MEGCKCKKSAQAVVLIMVICLILGSMVVMTGCKEKTPDLRTSIEDFLNQAADGTPGRLTLEYAGEEETTENVAINYDGEAYLVEQPAMDMEPVSRHAHGCLVEDDEETLAVLVLTDKEDYTWQDAREHMDRLESSTYTPTSADGEEGTEDFLYFFKLD